MSGLGRVNSLEADQVLTSLVLLGAFSSPTLGWLHTNTTVVCCLLAAMMAHFLLTTGRLGAMHLFHMQYFRYDLLRQLDYQCLQGPMQHTSTITQ